MKREFQYQKLHVYLALHHCSHDLIVLNVGQTSPDAPFAMPGNRNSNIIIFSYMLEIRMVDSDTG